MYVYMRLMCFYTYAWLLLNIEIHDKYASVVRILLYQALPDVSKLEQLYCQQRLVVIRLHLSEIDHKHTTRVLHDSLNVFSCAPLKYFYRMVRQLSTLPAGKDIDRSLNYF